MHNHTKTVRENKRNTTIDFTKGILVLSMVVYH